MDSSSRETQRTVLLRPRLSERFGSDLTNYPPILLLHAPAGYGKTTLAEQLVSGLPAHRGNIHHVYCIPGSTSNLWSEIQTAVSNAVTHNQSPIPPNGAQSELHRLTAICALLDKPTMIVIHEYHHATSPEIDVALNMLAEHSVNLRILVIARRVHLLDGALCARTVTCIDTNSLAFNDAESHQYAALINNGADPTTTSALKLTQGWPLAIRAVVHWNSTNQLCFDEGNAQFADNSQLVPTPHPALNKLVSDFFAVLNTAGRKIVLAASLTTTLSAHQAARLIETSLTDAQTQIDLVRELGLLQQILTTHGGVYRLHVAAQYPLSAIASHTLSSKEQNEIVLESAREREATAPANAFSMYLDASEFSFAEQVLAEHFTLITDDPAFCISTLSPMSDSTLKKYPTFAAALFMLRFSDQTTSSETLRRLRTLMFTGAKDRITYDQDSTSALKFAHQVHMMVGERMSGNVSAALKIAQNLDANLRISDVEISFQQHFVGTHQPVYLAGIANTAFLAGDFALARRTWEYLDLLMQNLESATATISSPKTVPTTLRPGAWRQAAASGLALYAANQGDFRSVKLNIERADALRLKSGEEAPLLTWVNRAVSRAHLAYQERDEDSLSIIQEQVTPWQNRIDQWSMLLQAETEMTRVLHGPAWALTQFEGTVARIPSERRRVGVWSGFLAIYETMLNTTLGNFTASSVILSKLPSDNVFVQFEKARLALFSGYWARALLLAQQIDPSNLTQRQMIDRSLITAVAAWQCNIRNEAFESLRQAGRRIEKCNLSMMLHSVPYDALVSVSTAAKAAGVCDVTELVANVPGPVRGRLREQLTRSEQLALEMMTTHPTLSQAAEELRVSPATVKRHRLAVYRKLCVSSRDEAIVQATRIGLLTIGEATNLISTP